jgi:hypothetical protein
MLSNSYINQHFETHFQCQIQLKWSGQAISLDDIGRTHTLGQIRDGMASIIARFNSYRKRHIVYSNRLIAWPSLSLWILSTRESVSIG